MGACTSRHEVLKNAGEAPLPARAIEEVEVKEEVNNNQQQEAPAPAADGDEAKRQSLGNLFNESEGEKGASENTTEQVKQEDPTEVKPQESCEPVAADVVETEEKPATEENKIELAEASDENKTEDQKPEDQKPEDQKPEDQTTKPETTSEKVKEEEKSEEKKSEPETTEAKTNEEEQKTTG
ncbi:hypothetical protein DH2020_015503 [Rehmannia glutinosa]|uniref:Uncharacterized protein n=1 Tax=Rehmannia glutinosa TaxID=99300 RepID=A0ABR0WVH6_REHGL